jgi:hypothetical protein
MSAVLNLNNPGYSPVATRLAQPLAPATVFDPAQLVAVDSADGLIYPINATTLGGTLSGPVVGKLGPDAGSSVFTSGADQYATILSGSFTLANGTSDNAFAQVNLYAPVFTADGLTANLTSTNNPTNPSGTSHGLLVGLATAISEDGSTVTVSAIPDITVVASSVVELFALGDGQLIIGNNGGAPNHAAVSGDATMTSGGVLTVGAGKITAAKQKRYDSPSDVTCTGSAQNIAHGLGVIPSVIWLEAVDTTNAGIISGGYSIVQGSATSTNIVFTGTANLKVRAHAIA